MLADLVRLMQAQYTANDWLQHASDGFRLMCCVVFQFME
jgi:hypothetical protein